MCRVMALFVVFEGFEKFQIPSCIFGVPNLCFVDLGEALEGFCKALKRFGNLGGFFVWIWKFLKGFLCGTSNLSSRDQVGC